MPSIWAKGYESVVEQTERDRKVADAAPLLLAACQSVLALLHAGGPKHVFDRAHVEQVAHELIAAVAAATGEENVEEA